MTNEELTQIARDEGCLADIRAAVGDPTGKLMQDDLVAHCAEMLDRVTRAEVILGRLSTGFWHHMLNENSEGENIGDQVLNYWRKYNESNEQVEPPETEAIDDTHTNQNTKISGLPK